MMRRRPQPGDALICFDGCSVEGGKRPLGTIFDPKRNPHELVIRRKLKPAPAAPAGGKGKAPPLPPPIRFSCNVAAVDDPSDKDKKGVAAKMLPFALDKKGAIVSLGGPSESKGHPSVIDELMIGDVVVSVDGKKWSGPVEMRAKAQKLDAKGSGSHVVVVDRPPMFISPEQYREMSGDVPAPTQVSTTQPPKAPPPPPPKPAAPPAAPEPLPKQPTVSDLLPSGGGSTATAASSAAGSSASSSGSERTFHLSGWSNSSKTFKQIVDCKIGGALTADLPGELGLTYVKKEEMDAVLGKMEKFTGVATGDEGRLKALMSFFNQHARVGKMDVGGGGGEASVLFFAGTDQPANAVGAGAKLVFYRTPSALTKQADKLGQLKPPISEPPISEPPKPTSSSSSSQPAAPPPSKPNATEAAAPPASKPAVAMPPPPASEEPTAPAAVPPIQPPSQPVPPANPPPPKAPTGGIEAAAGVNAAGEKIGPLGVGISPKNSSRGSARKPPPPIKEEDEAALALQASPPKPPALPAPTKLASTELPKPAAGTASASSSAAAAAAAASSSAAAAKPAPAPALDKPAPATPITAAKPTAAEPAPPKQSAFMPPPKPAEPPKPAAAAPAARPSSRPVAPSLAIEKAAAAVGIGSPRDSSKLLSQSDRTPGARAKPAGHALSGVDSYRARGAVNQTPGVFIPASMSYRATDEKIRTQRYPDTPAISIGVNQSSRSPSRMSAASGLKSPTPAGGLFSFSIPAASVSKALTARERFELTSRADYRKKEVIPLDQLGVSEITQEEYVTPRAQIPDPAAHDVKVTISKVGGASRIKGLSKFFEQFSDPGLEA